MKKSNILFGLSGSIAAYKSADAISKLVQKGYAVQVVTTKSALKFLGSATLEGLTGREIISDTFIPGKMMSHIDLVKWADIMILAPASASTINSMHHGLGNNLVLSLFLAHDWDKPYYIAPAMNTKMWTHPATTLSLEKLKNWGVKILEPEEGALACGDYGAGRMVSSDLLVKEIEHYKDNKINLSVLITAGGTKEPIDGARFISNISTGKTAAKVAEVFINNGWDVTFLCSNDSEVPNGKFEKKIFSTFNDLDKVIKSLIRNRKFDVFIHSAAVSDYSPLKVNEQIKINSTKKTLTLTFKKTPKLVNKLLSDSYNKGMKLIAFKFTVNLDKNQKIEKIEKLLKESNADIVIQNDISDRKVDRQTGFNIYNEKGKISEATDAHSLGSILQKEMREALL
tara:strand:- start:56 stop:1249 length:1194 start_codon:yes stop_codon:yes gene_type:complete